MKDAVSICSYYLIVGKKMAMKTTKVLQFVKKEINFLSTKGNFQTN